MLQSDMAREKRWRGTGGRGKREFERWKEKDAEVNVGGTRRDIGVWHERETEQRRQCVVSRGLSRHLRQIKTGITIKVRRSKPPPLTQGR